MPTYEYVCDACGHAFERFQRMSDPAVRKCPGCAKLKVRRIISGGAGVIFKGSGFYETDYKRARSPGGRKKDEAAEPASSDAKPQESKPEGAKPAAKPEGGAGKDAKKDPGAKDDGGPKRHGGPKKD